MGALIRAPRVFVPVLRSEYRKIKEMFPESLQGKLKIAVVTSREIPEPQSLEGIKQLGYVAIIAYKGSPSKEVVEAIVNTLRDNGFKVLAVKNTGKNLLVWASKTVNIV